MYWGKVWKAGTMSHVSVRHQANGNRSALCARMSTQIYTKSLPVWFFEELIDDREFQGRNAWSSKGWAWIGANTSTSWSDSDSYLSTVVDSAILSCRVVAVTMGVAIAVSKNNIVPMKMDRRPPKTVRFPLLVFWKALLWTRAGQEAGASSFCVRTGMKTQAASLRGNNNHCNSAAAEVVRRVRAPGCDKRVAQGHGASPDRLQRTTSAVSLIPIGRDDRRARRSI